ncbi:hypothetical protein Taro_005202 [Colocasia esculenta]|uniref:CCHC-type domain-containing protein n=1 Tax=Colocasia esculenta TaxID=4460 RepID=A0A843TX56_COLES|nr:hypothetical protein [Colocasia esculenta]
MLSRRLQRILAKKKKFQSGRRHFKRNKDFKKPDGKEMKKGEPICYECKKPGHIKAECPKFKKPEFGKKESSKKFKRYKKKAMAAAWGNSSDSNSESSSCSDEEEANLAFMANIDEKTISTLDSMAASAVSGSLGGYSAEFLTPEQQERFKFVKTKVCVNKAVDVADLEKNGMHSVVEALIRMQWMGVTTFSEVSYPDLVKAFYACLKTQEDGSLVSYVKGTQIKIDSELLHELFGVTTSGHSGVHSVNAQVKGLGIVGPGYRLRDGKLDINQLNAFNRLLHFIVCQILVPRSAAFSSCTKADSNMMYWAIQNKEINMAAVMMERMTFSRDQIWDTKSKLNVSLPYAHLLTKVFKHFGIDLAGAVVEKMGQSIRSKNLRKSGFLVIDGVWSKTTVAEGEAIIGDIPDVQKEAAEPAVEQPTAVQAAVEQRIEIEPAVPSLPAKLVAETEAAVEAVGSPLVQIVSQSPEGPVEEAVEGAADNLPTSIIASILRDVVDSVLTTPVTSETVNTTICFL